MCWEQAKGCNTCLKFLPVLSMKPFKVLTFHSVKFDVPKRSGKSKSVFAGLALQCEVEQWHSLLQVFIYMFMKEDFPNL